MAESVDSASNYLRFYNIITQNIRFGKMKKSPLQRVRAEYQPKLPKTLKEGPVKLEFGAPTESVADQEEIKKLFPQHLRSSYRGIQAR